MQRKLERTVPVPFQTGSVGLSLSLELSNDPLGLDDIPPPVVGLGALELIEPTFGWRAIRLFPSVKATIRTTRGTVQDTNQVLSLNRSEYVVFNGSDTSSLQYPRGSTTPTFSVEQALDANGGPVGSLSFVSTDKRAELKANKAFFGIIKVTYVAPYRVYRYRPEFIPGGNSVQGLYLQRNYGMVLALYDGASAVIDIPPSSQNEPDIRFKELYRVTSVVQVNENGAWERHPTFDSGGTYGGGAPTMSSTYVEYERVHEIGSVQNGSLGHVVMDTRDFTVEQGPAPGFVPDLTATFADATSFLNTEFHDSYSRLDLNVIKSDIRTRFGNIPGL